MFRFISIFLIIILGFIVYASSLNGEFVMDDYSLVKNNLQIKSGFGVLKTFNKGMKLEAEKKYHNYRPLQMITYAIDYSLWKLNVKGYHLTNIILHILAALTIYWFVNILFNDHILSLLTGVLFVVHPVHSEAVSYISGRADSLAVLFLLLCFIFYIKQLNSKNTVLYALMLLSYIFAILSKENGLVLPGLLLLYHYAFKREVKLSAFVPLLMISFAYFVLRIVFLKSASLDVASTNTALQRVPGFFVAITNYIKLLILPFNLHMDYGRNLFNFTHPQVMLGIILVLALLLYATKARKENRLIFFSASWFFLALLPVSNIYPVFSYMAEHFLYLPSIGFFLIIASLFAYLFRTKKLRIFTVLLVTALLGFYSYLTLRQNAYWKTPITFYERTLEYAPDSKKMYVNLGFTYQEAGDQEKAIASYKKAIEIDPDYAQAYNNLGLAYQAVNEKHEAIAAYKKAIKTDPELADAYYNLALAYYSINEKQEAIAMFKKAIEIKPDHAEAYYNLGTVYYSINEKQEAIAMFKKSLEINPGIIDIIKSYGE